MDWHRILCRPEPVMGINVLTEMKLSFIQTKQVCSISAAWLIWSRYLSVSSIRATWVSRLVYTR
jgi:hypothetical protein